MNNVIYINTDEWFEVRLKAGKLSNKKVLFVFGDSWTNNNYVNNVNEYPQSTWSYKLAEKIGYDVVVNISWDGGSNTEIYERCLTTMSCGNDYGFDECPIKDLGVSEIKVVIGWSSQYRDFGPIHKIFRPYTVTNIPNHIDEFININDAKSVLYEKFIDKLFKKEYYQYTTQLYTIFLQHYFKHHKVDYFMFMAFNPLVEASLKGTEWDLREHIDESKFYGLYDEISNMGQLLNQMGGHQIGDTFVVDQPYYYADGIMRFIGKFLNKDNKFKEFLEGNRKSRLDNPYFMEDGHPSVLGLDVISNELYSKINLLI
jgi:hypothetical protein